MGIFSIQTDETTAPRTSGCYPILSEQSKRFCAQAARPTAPDFSLPLYNAWALAKFTKIPDVVNPDTEGAVNPEFTIVNWVETPN